MKKITVVLLVSSLFFTANIFASADIALPDETSVSADQPLSTDKITGDVLNRFDKVYQDKKLQYDQLQLDISTTQNKLAGCTTLDDPEKDKCIADATQHLEAISQRASAIAHDLEVIQQETKDIKQAQ